MEPQQNVPESLISPLKKVTPLSKYLALALFIILPFLGGYVGYTLVPVKIVEVERVVIEETLRNDVINNTKADSRIDTVALGTVTDIGGIYKFTYPSDWDLKDTQKFGYIQLFNHKKDDAVYKKGWGENENKVEGGSVQLISEIEYNKNLSFSNFAQVKIADKNVFIYEGSDGEYEWTTLAIPLPNDSQKVVTFNIYGDQSSINEVIAVVLEDFVFLQ
jgi:hypothetical protein